MSACGLEGCAGRGGGGATATGGGGRVSDLVIFRRGPRAPEAHRRRDGLSAWPRDRRSRKERGRLGRFGDGCGRRRSGELGGWAGRRRIIVGDVDAEDFFQLLVGHDLEKNFVDIERESFVFVLEALVLFGELWRMDTIANKVRTISNHIQPSPCKKILILPML